MEPAPPVLSRLTADQYRSSLRDLFGPELVLPSALEPDRPALGLLSVGAAVTSISARGVEQYETAAFSIAAQVLGSPERRAQVVPCQPEGVTDDACAEGFVTLWGRRIWRRPLVEEEAQALIGLARDGATTLGDFHEGLGLALAAMLQSPNFLFRAELGEGGRYDPWALASRLSFFLWNTTPDDELLAAAESGALATAEGLAAQARRLIDDPRARHGVRSFYSDLLELYRLDELNKDPSVFVHFSTELGQFAREETLRSLERIVFDEDTDYRQILLTDRTYVNRHLAAIYGVPAAAREGFAEVRLPPESGRRGLLGQVSFLAMRSHPSATSAVLRGLFVRKVLLCGEIPPPPVELNTALPEPSATARTLRERNVVHLENDSCAACHQAMDPIGLGLENFDGIGRWRAVDHGAPIDPSGTLDGVPFRDAHHLAEVVHDHPRLASCLVRNLYRYATGRHEARSEQPLLTALTERFSGSGHRVKALLLDIVTSPGFVGAGAVQP